MAPTAICTAATACAAFHTSANRAGVTWRCSWTEVQAASGAIEAEVQISRSTPVDIEREILAARRQDLLVEQCVAVDGREVGGDQVVRGRASAEFRSSRSRRRPLRAFRSAYAEPGAQFLGELVEIPARPAGAGRCSLPG